MSTVPLRRAAPGSPEVDLAALVAGAGGWDRRPRLSSGEAAALVALDANALRRNRCRGLPRRTAASWQALSRLVEPLDAACVALHDVHGDPVRFGRAGRQATAIVLGGCAAQGRTWWGWTGWDWARLGGASSRAFRDAQPLPTETTVRPFLLALAYLLGGFTDYQHVGNFNRLHLAHLLFDQKPVTAAMQAVSQIVQGWGYRSQTDAEGRYRLPGILAQALLINRSPRLEDLTTEAFARLHAHPATTGRHPATLYALQRAVADLGHCQPPVRPGFNHAPGLPGVPAAWADIMQRWYDTSPLTPNVRSGVRVNLAKTGRWLAAEDPEQADPGRWTRLTCAAWVAAVDRLRIGDWVQRRDHLHGRIGTPIAPRTKAHILTATRMFFRDLQEWEWIPRRFDPARALAIPRSVAALISTDPRVIADDVWAKLLWAGLNLETGDLPGTTTGSYYPIELTRALALTWLFAGLRSDEITRLRLGCIRWQHNGTPIPGDSRDVLADDAVCLLDVPVHKTGTAFTKPVDPIVGQAIDAWQALRPAHECDSLKWPHLGA